MEKTLLLNGVKLGLQCALYHLIFNCRNGYTTYKKSSGHDSCCGSFESQQNIVLKSKKKTCFGTCGVILSSKK